MNEAYRVLIERLSGSVLDIQGGHMAEAEADVGFIIPVVVACGWSKVYGLHGPTDVLEQWTVDKTPSGYGCGPEGVKSLYGLLIANTRVLGLLA